MPEFVPIPYQYNNPYLVALLPSGEVKYLHPSAKSVIDDYNSSQNTSYPDFEDYIQESPYVIVENFHLSAPAIAFIEITNLCNLRCTHCYADSGKRRENEMTTPEIIDLIDQLAIMGVMQVFLTGGEVFAHKDVLEIIKHARTKPFSTQIFTNGLLITEEHLRNIPEGQSFFVSFDTAIPEKTVRGKMDYPKLRACFELIHKYGHVVRTAVSVHNYNIENVLEIFEWAQINKFPRPQWLETHPIGRALINPHIIIPSDLVDKVFEIYEKCMDKYHVKPDDSLNQLDVNISTPNIRSIKTIQFCQQLENATKQEKCGRSVVYFDSAGNVYPCSNCMSNKIYPAGNIRNNRFKEIWENGFDEFRRITFNDYKSCLTCKVNEEGIWCQFRCPPLSINNTGKELGCGATEYLKLFMVKSNQYWKRKKEEGYKLSITAN